MDAEPRAGGPPEHELAHRALEGVRRVDRRDHWADGADAACGENGCAVCEAVVA